MIDRRALIAVDLGAESCRVSLLRWSSDSIPSIELVHRFANSPIERADGLRWNLSAILSGVEHGIRQCASIATEGIRSIAVDGWAVDYVRLDAEGRVLADPFCYRDTRTVEAERNLHSRISPERMRELTGVQLQRINTVYQRYADIREAQPSPHLWLNLPEYLLHYLGGAPVAELSNATHSQLVSLHNRLWSPEIFTAAKLPLTSAAPLVPPGTDVGRLAGPLAQLPALHDTCLIAPCCHDTASAIAGIPASGDEWAYISSGTWSLIGTLLSSPCNTPEATADNFTNLAAAGGNICFHKGVNGMWLLRQCMDAWALEAPAWDVASLVDAAALEPNLPESELIEVDDPDLQLPGHMLQRINQQRARKDLAPIPTDSASAPATARLIFQSLSARYAQVLTQLAQLTGKPLSRVFVVGGGSRNQLLNQLTARATGMEVIPAASESSTLGNFAVQLATLEGDTSASNVSAWARELSR